MKKLLVGAAVLAAVVALAGCKMSGGVTLENGVYVSPDVYERLLSLEDDFRSATGLVGARSIGQELSGDQLYEIGVEILKAEFGDDWSNYVIEGEIVEMVGPSESRFKSRGFNVLGGEDAFFAYYMEVTVKYIKMPWGSWSWAKTNTKYYEFSTGTWHLDTVLTLRASIDYDASAYTTKSKSSAYTVTATGDVKWGFFPRIGTVVSEHEVWDEAYYSDHLYRSYIGSD